jgi:polyisoprenyl-phosphate glycosyltransferase
MPKISIVAPMFNEELGIAKFISSVESVMVQNSYDYEIVLVDDGSKDGTFEIVRQCIGMNPRVKAIKFSRNFGHQMALFAGLKYASGDFIIMMDSDLQHPPEIIPKLVSLAHQGFEVVHTIRTSTINETFCKMMTSKCYYWLINKLSYTEIVPGGADFRLISKKANDVFCALDEYDRFNRGLFSWIGFKSTSLEYQAQDRFAGKSSYTFKKMMSLAMNSITSFSGKPLRISFYLGMLTLGILFMYLIYVVTCFYYNEVARGWSSIIFVVAFLGGVQLISVGVLGEYIYRIYNEVKRRPHFIIDEKL